MMIPLFDGKEMELNRVYITGDSSEYTISTLRFYLSNFRVFNSKGNIVEMPNVYLFDLEDTSTFELFKLSDEIIALEFLLGTDSITNVSGILDGPLDPIHGMYWTWNSGYINFKIEGQSNRSSVQSKSFEYHIGGYLSPYCTSRKIDLTIIPSHEDIVINLHIDRWLKSLKIEQSASVMIPGKAAFQLSDELVSFFELGHGK